MKKIPLLFSLIILLLSPRVEAIITVDEFLTSSDTTISTLNTFRSTVVNEINSFPGANIQAGTISADRLTDNANPENRWDEAFNDFVYTGLIPPTATGR